MGEEKTLLAIIGLIIGLCCAYEVGLLTYAYFNADTVSCNLLWCEFTQERTSIESRMSQNCSINGIQVNCSDFKSRFADSWHHGQTSEAGGILGECLKLDCSDDRPFCNDDKKCPDGIPQNINRIENKQ